MATVRLNYDENNALALSFLSTIKMTGVFEVEEESPYSNKFVNKILESEQQIAQGKCKAIHTEDLWK